MSSVYDQLLDATITHLEELKSKGARNVSVSAETLRSLALPATFAVSRQTAVAPAALTAPVAPKPVPRPMPAMAMPKRVNTEIFSRDKPPAPALIVSADSAKAAAFAELQARVLACVKCPNLVSSRTTVVFGVGNIDSPLMFVGEAPGADEDALGEPFIGAAGQLLTKIVLAMGLSRADVYIANILKCRPDTLGQSAGNRKPTPAEMATCTPYLHEQIDLIKPKVLIALGATAVEGLLGKTVGITKLRGNWQTYRGIPLMPTYHPAYLLRNQAMSEKRRVWEDMLQVMEKLEMNISEKQRGFFRQGAA